MAVSEGTRDQDREADPHWSHIDRREADPKSKMVDVGDKHPSRRSALARARVAFPPGVLALLLREGGPKGPITEVARAAGILAAKRTGELIPMCHPLGLDHVQIEFLQADAETLEVRCSASCTARTGVEMEAMLGASVAALTVYDMAKGVDKGIRLKTVELLEKSGGESGEWRAEGWEGD